MTTRAELRAALRRRLEDTAATPLWDDTTLNDALADAIRAHGDRFPAEAALDVAVPTGATRVPVPTAIAPERIVRVLDRAGAEVPWDDAAGTGGVGVGGGQAWRWWGATLILARPAAGTTSTPWRIEFLAPRPVPTDDLTAVDLPPGDEGIVLALAAAAALRRRAVEDAKRGLAPAQTARLADAAGSDAERLIAARRRRARGGRLG